MSGNARIEVFTMTAVCLIHFLSLCYVNWTGGNFSLPRSRECLSAHERQSVLSRACQSGQGKKGRRRQSGTISPTVTSSAEVRGSSLCQKSTAAPRAPTKTWLHALTCRSEQSADHRFPPWLSLSCVHMAADTSPPNDNDAQKGLIH